MSGTLTVSGNEITDAVRLANTQGDGRTPPDSSYGVWDATTNLLPNGGAETNALGFANNQASTVSRTTATAKFGTACFQAVCNDNTRVMSVEWKDLAGNPIVVAAGTTYTFSVFCRDGGGYGKSAFVRVVCLDAGGATLGTFAGATKAVPANWQSDGSTDRFSVTFTTPALTAKVRLTWQATSNNALNDVYYFDGTQPEQKSFATPYVETTAAAASRAIARVQVPISGTDGALVDETACCVAFYLRYGFASTAARSASSYLFDWRDDASNLLGVYLDTSNKWNVGRLAAAAGSPAQSAAQTFAAGGFVAVVAAFEATRVRLSINGGAWTSVANSSVPVLAALLADVGTQAAAAGSAIDGDLKSAALGTTTASLTDADAAAIYALISASDAMPEDYQGVTGGRFHCTAVVPFATSTFEDETFVILDPDGAGLSRGLVPRLRIDVDVTTLPTTTTRTWTDITRKVRQVSFGRSGRSDERQRTEVGTLNAVVANTGGAVTALGIKKAQWVRVRARWNGVNYPRWQGTFESLPRRWPAAGKDDLYELRASGPLKIFRFCDLDGQTFPAQRNDQRFSAIATLAVAATGSVDTATDAADAIPTPFGEGSDALSAIQDIEASENGLLIEDPAGTVSFQGRHWRLLNSITSKGTIGDVAGQIPYRDTVSYEDDDQLIANIVSVTPAGGTAAVVQDATSQGQYWPRKLSRQLLTSDATIAQNAAEYLLARYKDPTPRIPQVEIPLAKVPTALKAVVLAANNSDRFTFARAATTPISEDVYVEKVSEKISPGVSWTVLFALSPADREFGWLLGDAVYGLLGSTTRLSY